MRAGKQEYHFLIGNMRSGNAYIHAAFSRIFKRSHKFVVKGSGTAC